MRFNAPGSGGESGYVIFDVPTKTMTAISDTKKTAMVMSLDSGPMAAKAAALPKATVEKSSGTDTVAGYSCESTKSPKRTATRAKRASRREFVFRNSAEVKRAGLATSATATFFRCASSRRTRRAREKSHAGDEGRQKTLDARDVHGARGLQDDEHGRHDEVTRRNGRRHPHR